MTAPVRSFRDLSRHRGGSVAAEFALILPLMATLLFGVMQAGLMIYTYNASLTAARNGARQIVFGSTAGTATTAVRGWLPGWAQASATITAVENDNGFARVRVSVPGPAASVINFLPMPAQITAEVAVPRVGDR